MLIYSKIRNHLASNYYTRLIGAKVLTSRLVANNPLYYHIYMRHIRKQAEIKSKKPPFSIQIETANVCNAECLMCAYPRMRRQKGFMSSDLYKKITNEACSLGVSLVNLNFMGEPLLDKEVIERIRYAKSKGLLVSFYTNGSLLDKKMGKLLIDSGIDRISVSFDGFSRQTYERIRIGLKFDKVLGNVTNLLKIKKEMGRGARVFIHLITLPENKGEITDFRRYWSNIADGVFIAFCRDWGGKVKELTSLSPFTKKQLPRVPCFWLWDLLVVLWTGEVTVCCNDFEGQLKIGDLRYQTLADVWYGTELGTLREAHLKGELNRISTL